MGAVGAASVIRRIGRAVWEIGMAPIHLARAVAPYLVALGLAVVYGTTLDQSDPTLRPASASQGAGALEGIGAAVGAAGVAAATQAATTGFTVAIGPVGVRSPYSAPVHSLAALKNVPFRAGRAIDEAYRLQFAQCDERDRFGAQRLARGDCSREPNNLNAFLRLPSSEIGKGAVFLDSALSLDLSGSWAACGRGGAAPIDARACSTFFDYPAASSAGFEALGESWDALFVSSDRVPYVTIPARARPGPDSLEEARLFSELSGVEIGDIGVVIYRDRIVPVLVADAAPTHRALGGSLALFDALGVSRCRRRLEDDPTLCAEPKGYGLGDNVVAILFPDSRLDGLTPDNTTAKVRDRAMERLTSLFASGEALAEAGFVDGRLRAPKPAPHPRMAMALAVSLPVGTDGGPDAPEADRAAALLGRRGPSGRPILRPEPRLDDGRAPLFAPRPNPRPAGSAIVLTATSPRDPAPRAAPRPAPRPERESE